MASTLIQQFGNMLNEKLSNELVYNSLKKRAWMLQNARKDTHWADGGFPIPFYASGASSVYTGNGLIDVDDIIQSETARGTLKNQIAFKGALKFKERDIKKAKRYDSETQKQTYLKRLIATEVQRFSLLMRNLISAKMFSGKVGTATNNGTALGVVKVNNIETYDKYQKLVFRETATPAAAEGYVQKVDKNGDELTVTTDLAGTTPLDFTSIGAGFIAGDGIYVPGDVNLTNGALQNEIVTMRKAFLPLSLGGSDTLHGLNKLDHSFLQTAAVNGGGIDASNLVQNIFTAFAKEIGRKAKERNTGAKPTSVLLSTNRFSDALAQVYDDDLKYNEKGTNDRKAYNYEKIRVGSPWGLSLDLIHVPELDDDIIPFVNPKTIMIASDGELGQRGDMYSKAPLYYQRSKTNEHLYIKDYEWDLNVAYLNPEANGIIYGVNY